MLTNNTHIHLISAGAVQTHDLITKLGVDYLAVKTLNNTFQLIIMCEVIWDCAGVECSAASPNVFNPLSTLPSVRSPLTLLGYHDKRMEQKWIHSMY
jgi:hypothetical protein